MRYAHTIQRDEAKRNKIFSNGKHYITILRNIIFLKFLFIYIYIIYMVVYVPKRPCLWVSSDYGTNNNIRNWSTLWVPDYWGEILVITLIVSDFIDIYRKWCFQIIQLNYISIWEIYIRKKKWIAHIVIDFL